MTRLKILLVVLVAVCATVPGRVALGRLRSVGQAAADIRTEAAALERRADTAERVAADPKAVAQLATLEAALPAGAGLADAIDQLAGAAASAGVSWTAGTPAPLTGQARAAKTPAGVRAWTLAMTVSGPDSAVDAFLDAAVSLDRLVVVDTVTLTAEGAATTAAVNARLFAYTPEER